ncbi:MAG: DUF1778 domain-containing protein [Pseudomonadota bacterium]
MAATAERPDAKFTIRLSAQTRDLIDRAAATLDQSRSEFVLESARLRASKVLLDQRRFRLDEAASEAFARVLDQPPQPVVALRALLKGGAPSEQ